MTGTTGRRRYASVSRLFAIYSLDRLVPVSVLGGLGSVTAVR